MKKESSNQAQKKALRKTDVSGSLPDAEQIEMHIRTHNPYPLGKQNNVDWSNGFERGVAWIIEMLSGNDR
jgi:hypothetical protein